MNRSVTPYRSVLARWLRATALLGAVALAAGCSTHADVDANGSAPAAASHLWVTVKEIWLAPAADTPPEAASGWIKTPLAAPVAIDLATSTPATLATLATGISLPAGTYAQVHLVTADSGDALTTAATTAGLTYNSQLTLTDASGATTTSALESPVPAGGITIPSSLEISGKLSLGSSSPQTATGSSSTTTTSSVIVAVRLDGSRDVLSYTFGTSTGYLLSPIGSAINEKLAGGISGSVDVSALAARHGPVIVNAEVADAGNTHHVVVARSVVGGGGSFTLYPLPATASGTTHYDLVITCSGANTILVRDIPVASAAAASAVSAQSTPFVLTAAPTVYANLAQQATTLPGGARVTFYQTVPGSGELPYSVDSSAVDMVSRRLPGDAFALSSGPIQVGNYQGGGPVSLGTTAPLEGSGGYLVGSEGLYRLDTLPTTPAVINGTSSAATPVIAPVPRLAANAISGRVLLTLASGAGVYDSGFVVVSAGNRVVETANVGALLAAGGGTVTLAGLPSGAALTASSGVPYQLAVRAWNSSDAAASIVRVASTGSVLLGTSGNASLTIQMP